MIPNFFGNNNVTKSSNLKFNSTLINFIYLGKNMVLLGMLDGSFHLLDLDKRQLKQLQESKVKNPIAMIPMVTFYNKIKNPNCYKFAAIQTNNSVKIWDLEDLSKSIEINLNYTIKDLGALIDGRLAIVGSNDKIYVYSISNGNLLSTLDVNTSTARLIRLDEWSGTDPVPSNIFACCNTYSLTIDICDLHKCTKLGKIKIPDLGGGIINGICYLGSGRFACAPSFLSSTGDIQIWDINQQKCIATLKGHTKTITYLRALSDRLFASAATDGDLIIWDHYNQVKINRLTIRDKKNYADWINNFVVLDHNNILYRCQNGTFAIAGSILSTPVISIVKESSIEMNGILRNHDDFYRQSENFVLQ